MSLASQLKQLVGVAAGAYARPTTAALKQVAKETMLDCEAPATAVLVAARHLLGPTFRAWEPETFWLQMDVCEANRDKLMASLALDIHPSFYWDYRIFGSTVLAFNNHPVHHDDVPKPGGNHLAWGVFEAELVFALTDDTSTRPFFEDEPAAFAAACLLDEGYVLPPDGLDFCEEHLVKLLHPEAKKLHEQVKAAWRDYPKTNLDRATFEKSDVGAQLARQADAHLYFVNRADGLKEYFSRF